MLILRVLHQKPIGVIFLLLPFFCLPSSTLGNPNPLFEGDEAITLTISANFRDLLRDRSDDSPYYPAKLQYTSQDNESISIDALKIKLRGEFRRKKSTCGFPPIRLNFVKKQTKGTIFEGQDKLKLVTHCRGKNDVYEQYLLQEYLIYKSYNLLTDYSFKVRLAKITYIDSTGKIDPITKYGFIIEDEDVMASRLDCEQIEVKNIHPSRTKTSDLVSVFQYMIGNTDWSIPGLHNIKLIKKEGSVTPISVPYDFDWSGIINPPYAKPSEQLNISSVEIRLYRGFCIPEEEFQTIFDQFRDKKENILALYENFEYLNEKTRKKSLKYINGFFKIIEDKRSVKREFYDKCRR